MMVVALVLQRTISGIGEHLARGEHQPEAHTEPP
jgi:hypothetical protein